MYALPRSKQLGFRHSGSPQRCRLGWACVLCPSQVRAAQVIRCLASTIAATYRLPAAPWSFLKPRSVKSMMQEASTSLHKGLTPAQVFQRGLFSSSFKAHDQKTHPTLQPGIQGPWDCTVTSTQKPRICSPSTLLNAGLLCHHQPCRAGPRRVNEPSTCSCDCVFMWF